MSCREVHGYRLPNLPLEEGHEYCMYVAANDPGVPSRPVWAEKALQKRIARERGVQEVGGVALVEQIDLSQQEG